MRIWDGKPYEEHLVIEEASDELIAAIKELVEISVSRLKGEGAQGRFASYDLYLKAASSSRIYQIRMSSGDFSDICTLETGGNTPKFRVIASERQNEGDVIAYSRTETIVLPALLENIRKDCWMVHVLRSIYPESIKKASEDIAGAHRINWHTWECHLDPTYPTT